MTTADTLVRITVADHVFSARFESASAPATCAAFLAMLPFESQLIQARWSGRSGWIPLGDLDTGVAAENQLHAPEAGQILLYPGGISETEILFPYGETRFACVHGELSGNHFLTVTEGTDQLPALGELVLWRGAQVIRFEAQMPAA